MPQFDISSLRLEPTAREKNALKGYHAGKPTCVVCGKTCGKGAKYLIFIEGDHSIAAPPSTDEREVSGYMGAQPVGSECLKKLEKAGLPAAWLFTFEG